MTAEQSELTIEVTSTPEAQTIALRGEADLLGAPKLEAALREAADGEQKLVVIDLRRLRFIDSSGLHALLAGQALCGAHGHEVSIIRGPENVQRLFELTGLSEALPFIEAPPPS